MSDRFAQWPWLALAGPGAVPEGAASRSLRVPGRSAGAQGARLAFDSMTEPRLRSVRGLQARRHCVYELDGGLAVTGGRQGSLEVMVERVGRDAWSVVGQVLTEAGEGWAECAVELAAEVGALAGRAPAGRTNVWGEFAFVTSGSGPWQLGLRAGRRRWRIAALLMP